MAYSDAYHNNIANCLQILSQFPLDPYEKLEELVDYMKRYPQVMTLSQEYLLVHQHIILYYSYLLTSLITGIVPQFTESPGRQQFKSCCLYRKNGRSHPKSFHPRHEAPQCFPCTSRRSLPELNSVVALLRQLFYVR